jgi:hypothetical protein
MIKKNGLVPLQASQNALAEHLLARAMKWHHDIQDTPNWIWNE